MNEIDDYLRKSRPPNRFAVNSKSNRNLSKTSKTKKKRLDKNKIDSISSDHHRHHNLNLLPPLKDKKVTNRFGFTYSIRLYRKYPLEFNQQSELRLKEMNLVDKINKDNNRENNQREILSKEKLSEESKQNSIEVEKKIQEIQPDVDNDKVDDKDSKSVINSNR